MEIGVYYSYNERGPGKVVNNLLNGFDKLGIGYKLNLDGNYNIILQNCNRLYGDLSNCILGPNICTLPIDNNQVMNFNNYNTILVPSLWVKNLYMRWLPEDKIVVWPVGINIDIFKPLDCDKIYDYLIYYKRRDLSDLNNLVSKLKSIGRTFNIIEYGKYSEENFIDLVSKSKYGIVIDSSESQGIAIQEMLSCNLPLLVWDVKYWNDRGLVYQCESTSIPYWSNECGVVFYDLNEFLDKIYLLENNTYSPRNFILKNLNMVDKCMEIIELINKK
jgi:hypothetical protein